MVVGGANLCDDEVEVGGEEGGGVLVSNLEMNLEVVRRGMEMGISQGRITILNPSPMFCLDLAMLGAVEVVVVNEGELDHLIQLTESESISNLFPLLSPSTQTPTIIVTKGPEGASIHQPQIDAVNVPVPGDLGEIEVVDTVGAGDAFLGNSTSTFTILSIG